MPRGRTPSACTYDAYVWVYVQGAGGAGGSWLLMAFDRGEIDGFFLLFFFSPGVRTFGRCVYNIFRGGWNRIFRELFSRVFDESAARASAE